MVINQLKYYSRLFATNFRHEFIHGNLLKDAMGRKFKTGQVWG